MVVAAQDGGGGTGYVVDKLRIMLNLAQLKAETGAELGNMLPTKKIHP